MTNGAELEVADSGPNLELTIRGVATIAVASSLHERLVEAMSDRDVVVHADALEKMDAAGLQLLFAVKSDVEKRGFKFALTAAGGAALAAIRIAGADVLLGLEST